MSLFTKTDERNILTFDYDELCNRNFASRHCAVYYIFYKIQPHINMRKYWNNERLYVKWCVNIWDTTPATDIKEFNFFLSKSIGIYTFLDFNFKHSFNYTQLYKGTHCTRVQESLVHLSWDTYIDFFRNSAQCQSHCVGHIFKKYVM